MNTEKTSFGKWLAHFIIDRNITQANIAAVLETSPSMLSLISTGRKDIPKTFRSLLILKFKLTHAEIHTLDKAIMDTQAEVEQIRLNSEKYVVCRTVDKNEWTKDMMKLFALCVNKMTPKEVSRYKELFKKISERPNKD